MNIIKKLTLAAAIISAGILGATVIAQDSQVPDLTPATTPLAGTELVHIVQGGNSRRVAVSEFGGGAVDSVNGFTGAVVLDTGDISEGTNLYYTDTRVTDNSSVQANTAKVTNATHTGDVTGATALTIAAKAVDVAMLADGVDGELITWDAAGVAATVPVGTATHVLTSGGVGVAPTFQAIPSGDMAAATFYDSIGGQALSLTRVVVNLSAQLTNSAPGIFSISSDSITVSQTAFYYVSYSIVCNLSSGTDSDVQLHLQIDDGGGFQDVISSVASLHVIHDLENTSVHGAVSIEINAGEILRLSAQGTIANGVSLISGLGTNFNIIQLKGPKGDTGDTGSGTVDTDAIHDNLAGEILLVAAKDQPTDFDLLLIEDAADSNNKKRALIGNLPRVSAKTASTTTGGTAIDFIDIPPTAKIVYISFEGMSLSGTENIQFQIGDAGGIETAGYLSGSSFILNNTANIVLMPPVTAAFELVVGLASRAITGTLILTNINANTWVASLSGIETTNPATLTLGGSKTLSAVLDRVRIKSSGTDTFDAMLVNVLSM
jgi:hypothetical protein